jgi:hypothetical protein
MKARPSAGCRTPRSPLRRNDLHGRSAIRAARRPDPTEQASLARCQCDPAIDDDDDARELWARNAKCGNGGAVFTLTKTFAWEGRAGRQRTASEPVADGKAQVEDGERNLHGQRSQRQPPNGHSGIGRSPFVAQADGPGEPLRGGEGDSPAKPCEVGFLEETVDCGTERRGVDVEPTVERDQLTEPEPEPDATAPNLAGGEGN